MPLPGEGLDYYRGTLAAADAGAPEAITPTATAQRMQEMEGDPGPTCAQWVADRDRTAVHVGALPIEPQLLLDRKVLGRECLIHLDQIHVVQLEAGAG